MSPATVGSLSRGIDLEDGPIAADRARILETSSDRSIVEVTLHSGRNRIVRRMLEATGHPVIDLVRRQFGPLHLGSLGSGQLRDLTREELGQLLTIARDTEAEQSATSDNTGPEDQG